MDAIPEKRGRGRPKGTAYPSRQVVRLTAEQDRAVRLMARLKGCSQAEAIRQLIEVGLSAPTADYPKNR